MVILKIRILLKNPTHNYILCIEKSMIEHNLTTLGATPMSSMPHIEKAKTVSRLPSMLFLSCNILPPSSITFLSKRLHLEHQGRSIDRMEKCSASYPNSSREVGKEILKSVSQKNNLQPLQLCPAADVSIIHQTAHRTPHPRT